MSTVIPDRTKEYLIKFIDSNNPVYLNNITDNSKVADLIYIFWNKMLPIWHTFVEYNSREKSFIGKTISVSVGYNDFEDKSKTFFHKSSKPLTINMKIVNKGEENNDLGKHYAAALEIIDDLMWLNNDSFYVRPIETSLYDFRYNFIYAVYYAVEYIWHAYEKLHTLGIDDFGYVMDQNLAKRILSIHLSSLADDYKWAKDSLHRIKMENIQISEEKGGWEFENGDEICVHAIIQTMEGMIKEQSDDIFSEEVHYEDLEDDVIADLIWEHLMITCIVNNKPLTFILHEVD